MPAKTLRELLRGKGAHVDPLASAEGLSVALAGRRLAGVEHTIWQLVWHMNYWMEYELRSLAGPEQPFPEHASESWPENSLPASQEAWSAEVGRLRRQVGELISWADRVASEGIGDHIVHPAKGESVLDILWQITAHNSYHTGQVALLRRAFGAWPPTGGGDSW